MCVRSFAVAFSCPLSLSLSRDTYRTPFAVLRSGRVAALFMFGQTGSGKTHTMGGLEQRCACALFAASGARGVRRVQMRYFEVCGKKALDLLRARDLSEVSDTTHTRRRRGVSRIIPVKYVSPCKRRFLVLATREVSESSLTIRTRGPPRVRSERGPFAFPL